MTNFDEKYGDGESDLQMDDTEEELEKSRSDIIIESSSKKKGKKKSPRYTKMDNVVDLMKYYTKLGNSRKVSYFQQRKVDLAKYKYMKYRKHSSVKSKISPKTYELQSAEIEMSTIASLRDMYFNRPQTLKEIEETKVGKKPKSKKKGVTEPLPPANVVKSYLDKYKQKTLDELFEKIPRVGSLKWKSENDKRYAKMKRSRDAIRNGYVVSVFNIEDDNLFTDRELFKIHRMKHGIYSLKEGSDKVESEKPKEVWEWNELLNNIPNLSTTKDGSTISSHEEGEVEDDPISKPEPEERMTHYLAKWFRRESPREDKDAVSEFQFFESKCLRKFLFWDKKSRLDAAIKFLKYAKMAYPELKIMKVFKGIEGYIGPVTLDGIQASCKTKQLFKKLKMPKKRLRYFRKLLKETKELAMIFVAPEIKHEEQDDIKKIYSLEELKEQEENLKNILEHNHLPNIYERYVDSCLPHPFNKIFISIANSLMKYNVYISTDPQAKEFKNEIALLLGRILQLILESMTWVLDTIFRSGITIDFLEEPIHITEKEEEISIEYSGEIRGAPEKSTERTDHIIKKLMIYIIKYMTFNILYHKRDPDVSSPESISSVSIGE